MASTPKRPPGWRPMAPEAVRALMDRISHGARASDHLRAAIRELAKAPSLADVKTAAHVLVEAIEKPEGGAAKAVRTFARSSAKLVPKVPRRETTTQRIDRLRAALRGAVEGPSEDELAFLEQVRREGPVDDDGRDEVRRNAPWILAAEAVDQWARDVDRGLAARFLAHVALRVPKAPKGLEALAHATIERHGIDARHDEHDEGWRHATATLRYELSVAWHLARETKTIAGAGVDWFVARAVEAMGAEPRKATEAIRQRNSRARRRAPKV